MKLFAITHINNEGHRLLSFANQGRNHYDTRELAESKLAALLKYNSEAELKNGFGPNFSTLAVSEVECYEHGDAKGIYLDGYFPEFDLKSTLMEKASLTAIYRSEILNPS